MLLDRHGTGLAVDPAFVQTLGWQPEQLLGRGFPALFHPEDREHAQAPWELVLGGETFIGEHRHRLIGCRGDSWARSQYPELASEVSVTAATDWRSADPQGGEGSTRPARRAAFGLARCHAVVGQLG